MVKVLGFKGRGCCRRGIRRGRPLRCRGMGREEEVNGVAAVENGSSWGDW